MTPQDPRGDSGTQPTPHYCTARFTGDDAVIGCPSWPVCLFPGLSAEPDDTRADVAAERQAHADVVTERLPEHAFTHALVEVLFWTGVVGVLFGLLWAVLA